MTEFVLTWAESTWQMVVDSAFLFIVGLVLAGLIWLFMNESNIGRYVRTGGFRGVLNAALIGVPLPLCSCSVLPVVSQLRKSGATKGAAVSFLIATPESGMDSILLTYSLTDPILTIARPITAFLAAIVAGGIETSLPSTDPAETNPVQCEQAGCCSQEEKEKSPDGSWPDRLWRAVKYAFTDLLKDLSLYLIFGFVLAGLIGAILAHSSIQLPETVTSGWIGYAGAVLVGLPMYICASSSTPLAAVLLAAGFSPGAILVFLLVGPATNVASLVVVRSMLGTPATIRYLLVIIGVAVLGGLLIDQLYDLLQYAPVYQVGSESEPADLLAVGWAVLLSAFVLYYGWRSAMRWIASFVLNLR